MVAGFTFLLIVAIVIITVCASCTKSAGKSGRIVHPVNTPRGVAVVYSNSSGMYIKNEYNI